MSHIAACAVLATSACAPIGDEKTAPARVVAALPVAHANNAVAAVSREEKTTLYSFNGLRAGKTWRDISRMAFACTLPDGACRRIADVPVERGRLASVAVALDGKIFVFGGYTVAEDGTEVSTPEVFQFNPDTEKYLRRADMPVPVDDAVAFPYASRYVYLVSGWHDDGNVSLVQVYDAMEDRWFRASDYPGAPVFGHAGGAVGNKFVVADGVAVIGEKDGRRQFGAVDEAWLGEIDPDDPAAIAWRRQPPHPGRPLYRMAAAGDAGHGRIVFLGGADNPYNYNGMGYDGVPATPSDRVFAFDLEADTWRSLGRRELPTMDHRGLIIAADGAYVTAGGLDGDRTVMASVISKPAPK
ncbi:MAG: Kelch repeat-containing protein [Parvularculaceae bacterium]